ncbi:MAG: aldo/keto reductase [Mesorhizobium sp.]|nr:aldo/keto reductase [Mesorhizobium sp.]
MKLRALGTTGLDIAPLVLGGNVFGWTLNEKESFAVLDAFLDHGFNAIDTADVYTAWVPGNQGGESETIIGKWLKARPGARERVVLFTKVGCDVDGSPKKGGLSRPSILAAADRSLARLGVETIDVYFSHYPDGDTPPSETLSAYEHLMSAGKVKAIGASNMDAGKIREALDVADREGLPEYKVVQPEYNLYSRDKFEGPLQDLCLKRGIGVANYYGLAAGFLTGKYRSADDYGKSVRGGRMSRYLNDRGTRILDALETVADHHSAAMGEVALAWLMAQGGITAPIASATHVDHVTSFARACGLRLSDHDRKTLDMAGSST